MENKEIYIDGVDVAEFRYFTSGWDFNNCGHICKGTECKYKRLWYKKQLAHKEQECEKYKQTLAEIKEIAENMNNERFYSDFDCKGCDMKNGCTYQGKIKILQKISEDLNDD